MKTISKVIVRDKNTLQIKEAAQADDVIDLSILTNVDLEPINTAIKEATDKVYKEKLAEVEKIANEKTKQEVNLAEAKLNQKIVELTKTIESLKTESASSLKVQKAELEKQYSDEITNLKNEVSNLKANSNSKVELALKEAELKHQKEVESLKENFNSQLAFKDETIREKEDAFLALQRQKAMLNVKQTGEDLESWCNNEVRSYMQNGLTNCSWTKDNDVVCDEGEDKGSKADYIFKVYANSHLKDSELLASVCLDMKDENPDSKNKKTNADYYKALDKNRTKKNCKYAVLVSNLESDKSNDLPIYKVAEYKDMYVVRPAYMMTFLNMIASLSTRFADMILADNEHKIELQSSIELMAKFEELKNTYLDKPLESLEKSIEELQKQNGYIMTASNKISETCSKIINTYIQGIQAKLSNFDIKMNREYKKVDGKITFGFVEETIQNGEHA